MLLQSTNGSGCQLLTLVGQRFSFTGQTGQKWTPLCSLWREGQPAAFAAGEETSAYFFTQEGKLHDSGIAFILCEVPKSLINCFLQGELGL
jgi:hypothetical protein